MALEQENVKFFDEMAERFDAEDWMKKISQQVTDATRARLDWIGVNWAKSGDSREVRLLDYACGTGCVSRALGPYVSTVKGVDLSPNMIKKYNEAAAQVGFSPSRMSAVEGNVISGEPSKELDVPEYHDFDVISVGLGYHHFADVGLATKRLAERLKPGGVLVVIDFLEYKADDVDRAHRSESTILKHGFGEEEIKKLFAEAGLVENEVSVCEEKIVIERSGQTSSRDMFFCRGMKPKA